MSEQREVHGRAARLTGAVARPSEFIPLAQAWEQWKAEQIRCAVVCSECHWIISLDFPCPMKYRSVLVHPECAAACFKSIAQRQIERRA